MGDIQRPITDHPETVANSLREDGEFDLKTKGMTFQINLPEEVTYEMKIEDTKKEGMMRHLEFELEWPRRGSENKPVDGSLE